MVGERPGVATRLQANARIRSLISVHFVCHKLALKISTSATIKQMQNMLNTLWQLLENSNKKTAIFMKVQLQMNEITLTNKNAKKKIAKKLKKASLDTMAVIQQCHSLHLGERLCHHPVSLQDERWQSHMPGSVSCNLLRTFHRSNHSYVYSGHKKLANHANLLSTCFYSAWLLMLTKMVLVY